MKDGGSPLFGRYSDPLGNRFLKPLRTGVRHIGAECLRSGVWYIGPRTIWQVKRCACTCVSGGNRQSTWSAYLTKTRLAACEAKRDFGKTGEPGERGKVASSRQLPFVIRKHDATRLHHALPLKLDVVFKSWTVTKRPSLTPR